MQPIISVTIPNPWTSYMEKRWRYSAVNHPTAASAPNLTHCEIWVAEEVESLRMSLSYYIVPQYTVCDIYSPPYWNSALLCRAWVQHPLMLWNRMMTETTLLFLKDGRQCVQDGWRCQHTTGASLLCKAKSHVTDHMLSVFLLLSYSLPLRFPYQFLPLLLLGLSVKVQKSMWEVLVDCLCLFIMWKSWCQLMPVKIN